MRGDGVVFRWAREGECGVCGAAIQTSEVVDLRAGEARVAALCDACVDRYGGLYPESFERRVRLLPTPVFSASWGSGWAMVRCGPACEHGVEAYVEEAWRGGLRFTCAGGAAAATRTFRCRECGVAVPERATDLIVTASDSRAVSWEIVGENDLKTEQAERQARTAFGLQAALYMGIVVAATSVAGECLLRRVGQCGLELPGPTLTVIDWGETFVSFWPFTLAGIVAIAWQAAKRFPPTPVTRAVMDVALAAVMVYIVWACFVPFACILQGIKA